MLSVLMKYFVIMMKSLCNINGMHYYTTQTMFSSYIFAVIHEGPHIIFH